MRERAVGFSHLVRVFTLLDGGAAVVGRVQQFAGQLFRHGVLTTLARGVDQPADRQGATTVRTDFDGDLIGRTTDAARTHFDRRRNIVQGRVEGLDRGRVLLLGDEDIKGAVDDVFGDGLLTFVHDVVHELGDNQITKLGIGQNFALLCAVTT